MDDTKKGIVFNSDGRIYAVRSPWWGLRDTSWMADTPTYSTADLSKYEGELLSEIIARTFEEREGEGERIEKEERERNTTMTNTSKPTKSVVKKWAFGDDYFNGDKYKSRLAAFNAARNAGRGVFVWKGNRYNTMTPEDKPEEFLKNHADYDYYLANLAKKEEGIDDKWKDDKFRDNEEKALSRAKAIQYHWVPKQYAPLSTPTELAQSANNIKFEGYMRTPSELATFTKDDIRNLNFHDFAGMEKAVKNQGNANNAFAKSMLARYGYGKWDLNQVEKDLNVKGQYRSFGGGDFGDMARNQASWLGTHNGSISTPKMLSITNPFSIKSSLL